MARSRCTAEASSCWLYSPKRPRGHGARKCPTHRGDQARSRSGQVGCAQSLVSCASSPCRMRPQDHVDASWPWLRAAGHNLAVQEAGERLSRICCHKSSDAYTRHSEVLKLRTYVPTSRHKHASRHTYVFCFYVRAPTENESNPRAGALALRAAQLPKSSRKSQSEASSTVSFSSWQSWMNDSRSASQSSLG